MPEQETGAKKADFGSAEARYNAAIAKPNVNQSELDRLGALEGFKRIVAPFDRTVKARNTDVGALINAGSGVGPAILGRWPFFSSRPSASHSSS